MPGFGPGFGLGFSLTAIGLGSLAERFDGVVGAIVETPAGTTPPEALGSVLGVFEYTIQREINRIGSFTLVLGVDQGLSKRIRRGWRISLVEESDDEDAPAYLMHKAIVMRRRYVGEEGGIHVLEVEGLFKSAILTYSSVHEGLEVNAVPGSIANTIAGAGIVTVPATDAAQSPKKITFSELTKYDALLKVAEYGRYNLIETWSETGLALEYVKIDNVPDSGFVLTGAEGSPVNMLNAHEMGIALIEGEPTFGYNGDNVITKIIPEGTDVITDPENPDSEMSVPLTLQHSTKSAPYPILNALNPDGSTYYFLHDVAATAMYSDPSLPIEHHFKRTDIKNPNNDPVSRAKAADALYAVASGELLARRSEMIEFESAVANGNRIWALPGYRMYVLHSGRTTQGSYATLDRHMLIVNRTDKRGDMGQREVSFTFAAPIIPLLVPDLPDEIIIPPPPDYAANQDNAGPSDYEDAFEDVAAGEEPTDTSPYSQCCDDPTVDTEEGPEPPPEDTEPQPEPPAELLDPEIPVFNQIVTCELPWAAACVNDLRFIMRWGNTYAAPDPTNGWIALDAKRDRMIVVLGSSSGDPVCVCADGTGTAHLLDAWESNTPANFGGDGYHWWRVYYVVPTPGFDYIDLNGTSGPFRQITFIKSTVDLHDGVTCADAPHGTQGTFGDGVELSHRQDLQYSGSHDFHAEEFASADQSVWKADFFWYYIDSWFRSIDNITIDKYFHDVQQNHDAHFYNSQPIPLSPGGGTNSSIDWILSSDRVDSVTAAQKVQADWIDTFGGSVRCLSTIATVRLRALCPTGGLPG